jgi:hypothetical protein
MHWTELLSTNEIVTLPWLGGRALHDRDRTYRIAGELPAELGWHRFRVDGSRRATHVGEGELDLELADRGETRTGYLVEDRLLEDGVAVRNDVAHVFAQGRPVFLVEPGLDRFARVLVARQRDGKLVYVRQEMPLGPEPDVLAAYQDRTPIEAIPGVTPALHLAFLWHTLRRERVEARRRAEEQAAREAAEREARQQAYRHAVGDAEARRRLAATDFEAAARAALAVGGAELLDVRMGHHRAERIVQFRFRQRRFECVVRHDTLRIVDSGICLIDHATEERGDQRFTLESLVAVIDEAIRTGRLVVFRNV